MSGIRPQQVSGARLKSLRVSAWPHKRTAAVQFRVRNQSVTNISDPYDYHWCATSIRVQHVSRVEISMRAWSSSQLVTRICVQHVFTRFDLSFWPKSQLSVWSRSGLSVRVWSCISKCMDSGVTMFLWFEFSMWQGSELDREWAWQRSRPNSVTKIKSQCLDWISPVCFWAH